MARVKQAQADRLAALPYAVEVGRQYLPGFAPGSPLNRYGVMPALRANPARFDTGAAMRAGAELDPVVAQQIAQLAQIAGI
jgi:hypothetical protein